MSRTPTPEQFRLLFGQLETMPQFLKQHFANLTLPEATRGSTGDFFAPIEH